MARTRSTTDCPLTRAPGTVIVNWPAVFDPIEMLSASIVTFAPTSGTELSSVTLPVIVAPWANTIAGIPTLASTTVSHLRNRVLCGISFPQLKVKGWGLLLRAQVRLSIRNGTVTRIRSLLILTQGRCSVSQFLDALFSHMGRNRATPGQDPPSGPANCRPFAGDDYPSTEGTQPRARYII